MQSSSFKIDHQQKQNAFIAFPLIAMIIALIIFLIPLQHYFSIGRYQHWGLSIFIWGLGYILQTAWSWRRMLPWTCASYLFGGIYIAALGMFFYANPWLDTRMAIQTIAHDNLRILARLIFSISSMPLVFVWISSLSKERQLQKTRST